MNQMYYQIYQISSHTTQVKGTKEGLNYKVVSWAHQR